MSDPASTHKRDLMQRLADGGVVCAEGYLFELERRGYLQAGAFVPEVVLDHPEAVTALHRELVRAGSDVVEAFTYYGHREKLRIIGKEELLERLNRDALAIAKGAAAEASGEPPLVAGNICNTTVWDADDADAQRTVRAMFEEQVGWAVEAGVDFIIAETFSYVGEALAALEVIKAAGGTAVVTLALHQGDAFRDGVAVAEAARRLEAAGADVVGLNCARGPATMLAAALEMRAAVACPVAALPVPYRTTDAQPTFQSLQDPAGGLPSQARPFPVALDPFTCNRFEVAEFARVAHAADIRYLGVCCGGAPHHVRAMAEALGRQPPASHYSPDMSKHYALGTDASVKQHNRAYVEKL